MNQNKAVRWFLSIMVLAALPLCLEIFSFVLPPQYEKTYLAALATKHQALKEAEKPKVVIAGGSGAAFALRCDLLEEQFPGYDFINYGLYAGLGTEVMLDLAEEELKPGDVVIFMPEISEQTLSDYFDPLSMYQASEKDLSVLRNLDRRYYKAMAGALPDFAADKAKFYFSHNAPEPEDVYASKWITEDGDINYPQRKENIMPQGYDPNLQVRFDPSIVDEEFCAILNDFYKECSRKGISLYFRFCPVDRKAVIEEDHTDLDSFTQFLLETLECPLLGAPENSLMDPGWFYDTNFHLNASGAVAYTAALAGDLAPHLGKTDPVSIEVPAMPGSGDQDTVSGDDRDADCFIITETEECLLITGLNEKGKNQKELIVPVKINGRSVAALDVTTFRGNTVLEKVTIQPNIRSLPDGLFAGCTNLNAVTLVSDEPSACTASAGLLEGCGAMIYVPQSAYSNYVTNYFWSSLAARIRGFRDDGKKESHDPVVIDSGPVKYEGNGGHLRWSQEQVYIKDADASHLRFNTLQGSSYFVQEDAVFAGWNTKADGSGITISAGSRMAYEKDLVLYAVWEKADDPSVFTYEEKNGEIRIIKYAGSSGNCVVPEMIGGLPVRTIGSGAFTEADLEKMVLPASLRTIEEGAFDHCRIGELVFSDTLSKVSDASFHETKILSLRINAARLPVYSGSYYDTFADKYDRLLSLKDQKKIVLASGSSGRYGYQSDLIDEAFPDYEVVNMGVYAYSNALPYYDLYIDFMKEGDILLSAPEFDAIKEQFCVSTDLDHHFWAMMESDYDMLEGLEFDRYTAVFDSFGEYQRIRSGMTERDYGVSPSGYDDDGNYYPFATYNEYGDLILPRENRETSEQQHLNTADYTVQSFPEETVEKINSVYRGYLEKGITVFFSYTPRNINSITKESTPEARKELEEYLERKLCVPVISSLEESLMDGKLFWKIDSHTGSEGAKIRTETIIRDLKAALEQ